MWDQLRLSGDVSNFNGDNLLPADDDYGVVIAADLASLLNLQQGDSAVVFTSTLSGQANAYDISVSNIVNTGNSATNDKFLTISLALARNLLDNQGAEMITILLSDATLTAEYRQRLIDDLGAQGFKVDIRTWDELSVFFRQVRAMFSLIFLVFNRELFTLNCVHKSLFIIDFLF